MPLSIGMVACCPTTQHSGGFVGGGGSVSDLRTQRTGVNHNQGEFVREFLGDFAEKPAEKTAEESAENPSKNPPENPQENLPQNPPRIPPWKHAPSSTCDRLSVAVGLCYSSGLFWVFNRNLLSTFRCKIHTKIRRKNSP